MIFLLPRGEFMMSCLCLLVLRLNLSDEEISSINPSGHQPHSFFVMLRTWAEGVLKKEGIVSLTSETSLVGLTGNCIRGGPGLKVKHP